MWGMDEMFDDLPGLLDGVKEPDPGIDPRHLVFEMYQQQRGADEDGPETKGGGRNLLSASIEGSGPGGEDTKQEQRPPPWEVKEEHTVASAKYMAKSQLRIPSRSSAAASHTMDMDTSAASSTGAAPVDTSAFPGIDPRWTKILDQNLSSDLHDLKRREDQARRQQELESAVHKGWDASSKLKDQAKDMPLECKQVLQHEIRTGEQAAALLQRERDKRLHHVLADMEEGGDDSKDGGDHPLTALSVRPERTRNPEVDEMAAARSGKRGKTFHMATLQPESRSSGLEDGASALLSQLDEAYDTKMGGQ